MPTAIKTRRRTGLTRRLRRATFPFLLLLISFAPACAGERPPTAPASAARSFSNQRLGYSWTLPDDWEPADPETLWSSMLPEEGLHAATKNGQNGPAVWVHVRDLVQIVPGPAKRDPEWLLANARSYAARVLERHGGQVGRARRVPMLGHEAIDVSGRIGEATVSIRTIYLSYRTFEFRCLGAPAADEWACAEAVRAFRIDAAKSELSEQQVPRVFRLHDAKLGLAFDPPDDSWLAYGPRRGWPMPTERRHEGNRKDVEPGRQAL